MPYRARVATASARAGAERAETFGAPAGAARPELLVSAEASANLVVAAHPAGRRAVPGLGARPRRAGRVLGTIAGDDTVLVISRDPTGGDALAATLLALADRDRRSPSRPRAISRIRTSPRGAPRPSRRWFRPLDGTADSREGGATTLGRPSDPQTRPRAGEPN